MFLEVNKTKSFKLAFSISNRSKGTHINVACFLYICLLFRRPNKSMNFHDAKVLTSVILANEHGTRSSPHETTLVGFVRPGLDSFLTLTQKRNGRIWTDRRTV